MEGLLGSEEVVAQQEPAPQDHMGQWKQRVAPVLAFGAWHSKWNDDLVKKLTSETTRMARLIHKQAVQTWVD